MGLWSGLVSVARSGLMRKAGRIVTYPLSHPQQTVQAMGKTTKSAVVGGGLGYLAWENVVNDKSVVRTASDVLVGKETTDKVSDVVVGTVEGVGKVVDDAGNLVEGAGNMLTESNNNMGGLSNFFQGLFSGNGLGMIGDFFKNIGFGKILGLSLAGFVGAAFLGFGRFGWLGKIAGAILGMMIIGNNFNMNKVMGGSRQATVKDETQRSNEQNQETTQTRETEQRPLARMDSEADVAQGPVIYRGR